MIPFIVAFLLAAQANAANLCYFPGGVQSRDVPCDPSAEVSMCCGSVAACLSNGLCKDESTTNSTGVSYARGTCTDPQWSSEVCPQQCQLNQDTPRNNSAFDFRVNGVQVWECSGQGFGIPADYCCESAAEKTRCCATATARFSLLAATQGNALAVQSVSAAASTTKAVSTTSASSSHTTSGGVTAATASSTVQAEITAQDTKAGVTTSSSAAKGTAPVSASAAASAIPETASSLDSSNSDSVSDSDSDNTSRGFSTAAVVGIGVGASIGSAVIVVAFVMFLLRRRGGKDSQDDSSSYYHGPPGPVQAGIVPPRYGKERDIWYDGQMPTPKSDALSLDMAEIDSVRHVHMGIGGSPAASELESNKGSPVVSKSALHKSRLFELA